MHLRILPCAWLLLLQLPSLSHAASSEPVDVKSRVEMFVDDFLVDSSKNVSLKLNPPERREIVLALDKPWESDTSAYFSVLRDDANKVRMYYRGWADDKGGPEQWTCCAL